MVTTSAGILLYRRTPTGPEVLLGHMGGPFWAKKDDGGWSIPKGEHGPDEDPLAVARREFEEELGSPVPAEQLVTLGAQAVEERHLARHQLRRRLVQPEPGGPVDLGELLHPARTRRPLQLERVAACGRGVQVTLCRPHRQHLAAGHPELAERHERGDGNG